MAKAYGKELILDLYDCNPRTIKSKKRLLAFVGILCRLIKMQSFGRPVLVNFGSEPRIKGYSLVQLIETSSIVGHFAEASKSAYINIFSCKDFDSEKAAKFCKTFFKARRVKKRVIRRI